MSGHDVWNMPGARLTWARTGARRRQLRTGDEQTLVTLHQGAFTAGGRTFGVRRLLHFPVHGTKLRHAIMTAVDEPGNEVASFRRLSAGPWRYRTGTVEIGVHPEQRLADDLAITLALSARWLSSYFQRAGTG